MLTRMPITLSLMGLSCFGFFYFGAGAFENISNPVLQYTLNIFRHGTKAHLLGNLFMLGVCGYFVEPQMPRRRFIELIALLCVVPPLIEYAIAGSGFLGISGVAYGLAAFALYSTRPKSEWVWISGLIAIFLVADKALSTQKVAIYSHFSGLIIGGAVAMLGKLFGNNNNNNSVSGLIPMEPNHINTVVSIINETDDDDAREAKDSFSRHGLENMFVMVDEGQVIGVTGYQLDAAARGVAWLSWTYLSESHHGQGWGKMMIEAMLNQLDGMNIRKIFISTSDYREDGEMIYGKAHDLYRSFGAAEELKIKNYFAPQEAQLIFSMYNQRIEPQPPQTFEGKGCRITGIVGAPETENAAAFEWEETERGLFDITEYLDRARAGNADFILLTIPSDISDNISGDLERAGFENAGLLKDYYDFGLHQAWWICF